MTPRRLRPLRAITLVALIALGSAGAHRAGANAITDWNNITTDTILGALPAMYDNNQRVLTALYLTFTSGEYLVQH